MSIWSHMTVTAIDNVYLVPSIRGKDCIISNRKSYGLSFSYGGQISYHLNGKRFVSNKDNAILLPKGQTYFLKREETGNFPVINFLCTEELDVSDFIVTPLRNPESYRKDWERMQALWLSQKNPAKVMSILYGMLARLGEEEQANDTFNLLSPAMEYLGKHFDDPLLSNEILAKQSGVSEVYFRKRFKDTYGVSPHQYLLDIRIRHAKALLSEQATTVTVVSEACGFSSVYHFCRAFKQITGQTPTEFAKTEELDEYDYKKLP